MRLLKPFCLTFAIFTLFITALNASGTGATIEGNLVVPGEYKKAHPSDYKDIFYKDVVLHLEGSPETSKMAYATYSSGSFSFHNVQSGHSYILSAESPNMRYKPVRVDVNKSGLLRVREADRIDTARVAVLPTQIKLQALGRPAFFHPRQKLNLWGMVMGNPMILLMLVSCGLMFILPKMVDMNDPEMKKELENNMSMFNKGGNNQQAQVPDVAELMSNWLGTGGKASTQSSSKKKK